MGIRMKEAVVSLDPTIRVAAIHYDKRRHGVPRCIHCGCPVQGVPAHVRDAGNICVSAFFRLPGKARASGQGHARTCLFDVDVYLERLVASSSKLKKFDPQAEPLLSALQGKKIELRLHILWNAIELQQTSGNASRAVDGEDWRKRYGTHYIRSERVLGEYLKGVKGILELISGIEKISELVSRIHLRHEKQSIPWNQFFFGIDQYGGLHRHLQSKTGSKAPVAIVVEIDRRIQPVKRPGWPNWQVTGCARGTVVGDVRIRPMLYIESEELAHATAQQRYTLICARPTVIEPRVLRGSANPVVDIRLQIKGPAQVCKYDLL